MISKLLYFLKNSKVVIIYSIDGETKNNARAIRSLIESDFLQREVVVHVAESSNGESIFGYLVNDTGNDVRKVLLENGHAKLAK